MDPACRVAVNPVECHGCGGCAELFPQMFDWDPEADRPIPREGPFACEDVRQAMALCPRHCIEAVKDRAAPGA